MSNNLYRRYCFPLKLSVIAFGWLYNCFALSYRDIEKIMLCRGIEVTYEAIRRWNHKFAQTFANKIRRRRPKTSHQWHLDEMEIKIDGQDIIFGVRSMNKDKS